MVERALRTSGLFLLLFLIKITQTVSPPWILSVRVLNSNCADACDYELNVNGNFEEWSVTSQLNECMPMFYGKETIQVPNTKLYFCAKIDGRWLHQGNDLYLENGDVIRPDR